MFILPDDRRPLVPHPPWCDASRCNVGRGYVRHDGHRSAPLTLGRVTVTMTRPHGERDVTIEVRTRTVLKADEADTWRTALWLTAVTVDEAVRECPSSSDFWQNDHSMRHNHDAHRMSTPTPGGERSW